MTEARGTLPLTFVLDVETLKTMVDGVSSP